MEYIVDNVKLTRSKRFNIWEVFYTNYSYLHSHQKMLAAKLHTRTNINTLYRWIIFYTQFLHNPALYRF